MQCACLCGNGIATHHFRSKPLGLQWSHTADTFWWRQCVEERKCWQIWGSASQLTFFFLDRTCTVKSVGSETKLRSFSSMQISAQLQLRYLDFSFFTGCGFSWSGTSPCLCSSGRWNVSSLVCVCAEVAGVKHFCVQNIRKVIKCTCHLKMAGRFGRYQWKLLFRRIETSF